MGYYLGLDIGGTKCAVLLGALENARQPGITILEREAFPTDPQPQPTLARLFAVMEEVLARHGLSAQQLAGIGVSCGGPLDTAAGLILSPPNLCRWERVPIVELLQARYPVPVVLENDANACALAEWKFGAARGYSNVVFLTFGTGLGAGLILGGRLYSGTGGMAGEVGHLRLAEFGPVGYGKSGSFEGFCSGSGIAQLARQAALEQFQLGKAPSFCQTMEELPALTAQRVAQAAYEGDPLAREIYACSGRQLGRGLALLVDILNPELIVLGSIFGRCENLLRPAMEETLKREALPQAAGCCRIVPAGLGEAIGDYAALALVAEV